MSDIHIVNDYPHPVEKVWRALTDPALIPLWTKEGLGGRAEGFSPAVGTKFRLVAKPQAWWRGFVECEVVEARAPSLLRYSWIGDEGESPSLVSYQLDPIEGGTRFTFDHTGFSGIGGFMVSRVLRRVRKKMLNSGVPAVLNDMDEEGNLRPDSVLRPKAGTEASRTGRTLLTLAVFAGVLGPLVGWISFLR